MYSKSEKVKTSLNLNKELWEKFKEFAFNQHKKFKGALTYEVEEALRFWIATHTNAQTTNKINPNPKVYIIWQQVKGILREKGYWLQAPLKEIRNAIALVRGNDYRTIRKWLIEFKNFKLIKEVSPQIYEII
jgi:hypothetical protein